jgi:hypothetical protein
MMQQRSAHVTSRFQRRVAPGRHDLVFKVAFGTDGRAARFFGVSRMTIWRWRHGRSPLPEEVLRVLPDLVQAKVAESHQAQTEFRYFLAEAPSGQAILFSHPIQLKDGRMAFVQRRRAKSRRPA